MRSISLSLLFLLPLATAEVDCRTACHSCHLKEQPLEMLEIYCAMCQECKDRRKDRLKMKMKLAKKTTVTTHTTTTESFFQMFNHNGIYNDPTPQSMEFGDIGLAELMTTEDIPEGCPTSATCSDDEGPPRASAITTTTTTTTTKKPCPPVKICKKKTTVPLPTPSPSTPPPFQPAPHSEFPPSPYMHLAAAPSPPPCAYQSQVCPPPPMPMFSVQHYMAPPQQWPMQPVPLHLPPPAVGHLFSAAPPRAAPELVLSDRGKKATDGDYLYMYVGLPKNALSNKG